MTLSCFKAYDALLIVAARVQEFEKIIGVTV